MLIHLLRRSHLLVIALAVLSGLPLGCSVPGTHDHLMRYEAESDSFVVFRSWTNIAGRTETELEHVKTIWTQRNSIITIPFTVLWFAPAIERLGVHQFRWIDLNSVTNNPNVEVTPIDLDSIRITASEFYLNQHGNLCFYHEQVIPGETADAMLTEATPHVEGFVTEWAEELRKEGYTGSTWDELRQEILKGFETIDEEPRIRRQKVDINEMMFLDQESFQRLLDCKQQKSIKLSRLRDEVSMILPLSAVDCREAVATLDLLRSTLTEQASEGNERYQKERETLAAVSLHHIEGTGLRVSFNMSTVFKLDASSSHDGTEDEPRDNLETYYRSTIDSIRKANIPIRASLNFDDVMQKYKTK